MVGVDYRSLILHRLGRQWTGKQLNSEPQRGNCDFTLSGEPATFKCVIIPQQTHKKLTVKMDMWKPYVSDSFMELKLDVFSMLFSIPPTSFLPSFPSVMRTVSTLRRKDRSMKSPDFAIWIVQQPNVFRSKVLPPWMRSQMQRVLTAQLVSSGGRVLEHELLRGPEPPRKCPTPMWGKGHWL